MVITQEDGSSPPDPRKKRRWFLFGLRATLSIGILGLLFYWLPYKEIFSAMARVGLVLWIMNLAVHILAHFVAAMKWRILLAISGIKTSRIEVFKAYCAGLSANILLPSIVGGDIIRAAMIARGKQNLAAAVVGGVGDRLTDFMSLIVLAWVALLLLPTGNHGMETTILWVATTAVLLGLIGFLVLIKWIPPSRFPGRIASVLAQLKQALDIMRGRLGYAVIAMVISILVQGFFVFQNVVIANAMGIHIPALAWLLVWPLGKLAALIPVSLAGLGLREGVMATMLVPFGVSSALAVAQSLVWQTIMYGVGLFGWVVYLATRGSQRALEKADR